MEDSDWFADSDDAGFLQGANDAMSMIVPLCVVVNQNFTRVAVGHEEGFLVFAVHPECGEAQDDLAHMFAPDDAPALTELRRRKPALRSGQVDARYNIQPELLRALHRSSQEKTSKSKKRKSSHVTAAKHNEDDQEEEEEEAVTMNDILLLSRLSLARLTRRGDPPAPSPSTPPPPPPAIPVTPSQPDKSDATPVSERKPSAPLPEEDDEDDEEDDAKRNEGVEDRSSFSPASAGGHAEPQAQTWLAQLRRVHGHSVTALDAAGESADAPSSSLHKTTRQAIAHIAAGGVAALAMLYDYPQLALVGGGPKPMGPPDEVIMLRNGDIVNRIRVPVEGQATGELSVPDGGSAPVTPDRVIVQVELDNHVLFVCTTQAFFIFSEPDSRTAATCRFTLPLFHTATTPEKPLTDMTSCASSSIRLGRSTARGTGLPLAQPGEEKEVEMDEEEDEDTSILTTLQHATAQPLPSRPLLVDHDHGLFLLGCSAAVLHSPVFTDLVSTSGLSSTIQLDDAAEAGAADTSATTVTTTTGAALIDSIGLFSYHSWTQRTASPGAGAVQIAVRVVAARAHVTRSALDRLALHIGPLTSFAAAAVERACVALAETRAPGSAADTNPNSNTAVSWRPAQNPNRAKTDWRTVGERSRQHLTSPEAILVATSSTNGTRVQLWCLTVVTSAQSSTTTTSASGAHGSSPSSSSAGGGGRDTYRLVPFRDLRLGVRLPTWKGLASAPVTAPVGETPARAEPIHSRASTSTTSTAAAEAQAGNGGSWAASWSAAASAATGGFRSWMRTAASATAAAGANMGLTRASAPPPTEASTPASPLSHTRAALAQFDDDQAHHRVYQLQFVDQAHFVVCVRHNSMQVFAVGEAEDDLSGLRQERVAAPAKASSAPVELRSAHQLALTSNRHSAAAQVWRGVNHLLPLSVQNYGAQQWAACTAPLFPTATVASTTAAATHDGDEGKAVRAERARWLPFWLSVHQQEARAAAELLNAQPSDVAEGSTAPVMTVPVTWGRTPHHLAACLVIWEQDRSLRCARQAAGRTHSTVTAQRGRHGVWPSESAATPSTLWTERVNGAIVPTTTATLEPAQKQAAPWLGGGVASKVVLTVMNCEGRCLTARVYADTADVVLSTSLALHT